MSRRRKPSDPQAIALRKAEQLAMDRQSARNPSNWGVDPDIKRLPTSSQVRVVRGTRARIVHAPVGGVARGLAVHRQLLGLAQGDGLGIGWLAPARHGRSRGNGYGAHSEAASSGGNQTAPVL